MCATNPTRTCIYYSRFLLAEVGAINTYYVYMYVHVCQYRACSGHCPYGELLLLIAIHLKEKQLDQIEELIAETLNMKVSVSIAE